MNVCDTLSDQLYFGVSPVVQKVKANIGVAAKAGCAVLILGETGTGKSALARLIHDGGARKGNAFVDVNCSGLRGDLLKSELFGYAKGAFTGSVGERAGLIEEADGGTLFLDEIGDMAPDVQSLLLKVIEEKIFRRVGEGSFRRSDFRLICATNRDLRAAVAAGAFREDLFYRINAFPITVPPLRERKGDFHGLLRHLLDGLGYAAPLSGEIANRLAAYPWPGNIRQLRNGLEKALAYAQGNALALEHISDIISPENAPPIAAGQAKGAAPPASGWNLSDLERAHLRRALEHFGGDKFKASEALGVSLSTIYRKLDKAWEESGEAGGGM
ncbi:MAG: sigma-54 dependent transcriptional regulator [Chitinispirillales bacterium]|jgi:transcriptional regulator with PAS, ATPase and Fis domain|nr:sigma-54 dependent transcriptional regulator [Chitinispirillales bacterium]